jgi:hypothetical protein
MSILVFLSPRARTVSSPPLKPQQRRTSAPPTAPGKPEGGRPPDAPRPRLLVSQGGRRRALQSDGILGLRWLR